jgi:LacI family transcriptional regulator
MSNVTISDVAKKVGVSESTVSRFLSGFKVRNADVINQAIKDLDYRPNIVARNLKSGKTGLIAVVVPDITNPFFASIVRGAEVAAGDEFMIQLINTGDDLDKESWALRRMVGRVDGMIYVPLQENSSAVDELDSRSLPMVFVDRVIEKNKNLDSVLADNFRGGELAARHLVEHGHSRIAHIGGPISSTPGKARARGFVETLRDLKVDLPSQFVVESDFTTLGGYQATMALLALKSRPTALFVANNLMTIGALKALKERGISVPQEMAIIGFDDHELSDLVDPPLTVISRDAHLQGALAMQTLLEKIRGGNQFPPKQLKVDVNLVVRGSCGSTCRYRNSKTSEFPKTLSASSRSK